MGLQSLPVAFGVDTAKWICVSTIDATQLGIAAYLAFGLNEPIYAAVLVGLVLPQVSWATSLPSFLFHVRACPCCRTGPFGSTPWVGLNWLRPRLVAAAC